MQADGSDLPRRVGARVAELRRARGFTQDAFAARLGVATKYYQRIERGLQNLTLRTLERLADALGVPVTELLEPPRRQSARPGRPARAEARAPATTTPFRVLADPPRGSERGVPLVSIEAAAGATGAFGLGEIAAWVVPRTRRRLRPGMFVARVSGDSMEPLIPSGTYCLFRAPAECRGHGEIVLVESRAISDPETGGHYAVKRVYVERARGKRRIRLVSENPAYAPIVVEVTAGDPSLRLVASFVEALG